MWIRLYTALYIHSLNTEWCKSHLILTGKMLNIERYVTLRHPVFTAAKKKTVSNKRCREILNTHFTSNRELFRIIKRKSANVPKILMQQACVCVNFLTRYAYSPDSHTRTRFANSFCTEQ